MVMVQSIELNESTKTAKVSILADTKNEITAGMTIVGLPAGYTLGFGSTAMTTAGELAFLKSDGTTWNWGD